MALPGAASSEPARSRGTSISKGPTWRSMVLVVVPPKGACRGPRSSALPTPWPRCSAGSARSPRPRNLLGAERGAAPGPRSSRASPESICSNRPPPGPGLAQPPGHIAPVNGLVPLLSHPQSVSVLPSGLTQTIEHARAGSSSPCRWLKHTKKETTYGEPNHYRWLVNFLHPRPVGIISPHSRGEVDGLRHRDEARFSSLPVRPRTAAALRLRAAADTAS